MQFFTQKCRQISSRGGLVQAERRGKKAGLKARLVWLVNVAVPLQDSRWNRDSANRS